MYNDRRCIRTYNGHRQAVRDINFNNSGNQFLSAGYDRYIKLWDTETGRVVSRFTSRKIPYCVKFNPDNSKQHLFVAGTSDKKIICVSILFYYTSFFVSPFLNSYFLCSGMLEVVTLFKNTTDIWALLIQSHSLMTTAVS